MTSGNLPEDLVCPAGRAELELKDGFIICTKCGVKYPIIDGIPILMIEEALLPEGISNIDELECMKK